MTRTIFDIEDDIRALDDLLHESGGDITDEGVEQYIAQLMEELREDLENKVDGFAAYIGELKAREQARKSEADRLRGLAKSDGNAAAGLRGLLLLKLKQLGIKKLKTKRYNVSVSANGGKQPLDIVADRLPGEYRREVVTIEIDRNAIERDLKAGVEIPGVTALPRGESLRIK